MLEFRALYSYIKRKDKIKLPTTTTTKKQCNLGQPQKRSLDNLKNTTPSIHELLKKQIKPSNLPCTIIIAVWFAVPSKFLPIQVYSPASSSVA